MTHTTHQQHFPSPAHKLLNAFAGTWRTSGMMPAQHSPVMITGTDTYKWLPGGYFLLHTVDVMMGEERRQSIEVIGYDTTAGHYTMHAFDDKGTASVMTAECRHDVWTFQGDTLRFSGEFDPAHKVISGVWETLLDGHWTHLMNIALNKQVL